MSTNQNPFGSGGTTSFGGGGFGTSGFGTSITTNNNNNATWPSSSSNATPPQTQSSTTTAFGGFGGGGNAGGGGFGGGVVSASTPSTSSFGFGGGGGGFGTSTIASSSTAPAPAPSTFGSSNSNPFGGGITNTTNTSFASPSAPSSSTTTFGGTSSGFGGGTTSTAPSFGTSNTFGGGTSTTFGSSSGNNNTHTNTTTFGGFGTSAGGGTSSGSNNNNPFGGTGIGSSTTGTGTTATNTTSFSNPFGSSNAGTSSNTGPFGGGGGGGFGTTNSIATKTTTTTNPFGGSSGGFNSSSSNPFASPTTTTTSTTSVSNPFGGGGFGGSGGGFGGDNDNNGMDDNDDDNGNHDDGGGMSGPTASAFGNKEYVRPKTDAAGADKKARELEQLKAKLALKKQQLEEKKKRKLLQQKQQEEGSLPQAQGDGSASASAQEQSNNATGAGGGEKERRRVLKEKLRQAKLSKKKQQLQSIHEQNEETEDEEDAEEGGDSNNNNNNQGLQQQQQQQQPALKQQHPHHQQRHGRHTHESSSSPARGFSPLVGPAGEEATSGDNDEDQKNQAREERFNHDSLKERKLLSKLPPELQDAARAYKPQSSVEEQSGSDAFDADGGMTIGSNNNHSSSSTSTSLVGECLYMCPNDELLRREYENDIQLLEICHSKLHPSGWNLRHTCVKRFRRSAAAFKLDIPSLVRPPHILEQTVSYLEEWVMERDRQGLDPRYMEVKHVSSDIPPSLDVYQFIWDRTRMIRKDFILQNYIAGSVRGKNSATAVRCHERIARWHILCEHQLSHIEDYVTQQSVQNIQELGQTLKTLNLLYDDPLHRSTIEEELQSSSSNRVVHGCSHWNVQGRTPVDYDGTELDNSCSNPTHAESRLVGNSSSTSSGTAEAEMRGLYILLTMPNDGGMEVLKYAAKLCRTNSKIFRSPPVQLALQIFRARKERNYVKFFQLLKSTETPYLFACVMFNYVEEMRKWGLFTMSKTYGVRVKDPQQNVVGVDDTYPLGNLQRILCYESLDEARQACHHYGIVVKDNDDSNGMVQPVVLWKASRFKEPRDPKKGVHIPLKPHKMMNTIESKLVNPQTNKRVTRLAICRGQVSGMGACTTTTTSTASISTTATTTTVSFQQTTSVLSAVSSSISAPSRPLDTATTAEAQQQRLEQQQKIQEDMIRLQKQQEETKARIESMMKMRAAHQLQRQEEERKRREEEEEEAARRQEEEVTKKKLLEQQQQREKEKAAAAAAAVAKEEEERRRRTAAAEAEAERQRQLFEERQRAEAKKRQQEEDERRRRLLAQQQEEEERQRRKQQEEAAAAAAKAKQEAEERKRRRIEQERLAAITKAANERRQRVEREWNSCIQTARKTLLLKLWKRASLKRKWEGPQGTQMSLYQIDPTYTTTTTFNKFLFQKTSVPRLCTENDGRYNNHQRQQENEPFRHYDSSFFRRLTTMSMRTTTTTRQQGILEENVPSSLMELDIDRWWNHNNTTSGSVSSTTILCTIAIVFSSCSTSSSSSSAITNNKTIVQNVKMWILSRLEGESASTFNKVHTFSNHNIRIAFVDYEDDVLRRGLQDIYYDAVLYVATPCDTKDNDSNVSFPTIPHVGQVKASAVLELLNTFEKPLPRKQEDSVLMVSARAHESYENELTTALDQCVHYLVNQCAKQIMMKPPLPPPQIASPFLSVYPLSLTSFVRQVIHQVIWNVTIDEDRYPHRTSDNNNNAKQRHANTNLVNVIQKCFLYSIGTFDILRQQLMEEESPYKTWPHPVFVQDTSTVGAAAVGSDEAVVPFYFSTAGAEQQQSAASSDNHNIMTTQQQRHLPFGWLNFLHMDHVGQMLSLLFTPRLLVDDSEINKADSHKASSSLTSLETLMKAVLLVDMKQNGSNSNDNIKDVDLSYDECMDLLNQRKCRTCVERFIDHVIDLSSRRNNIYPHTTMMDTIYVPNHITSTELINDISQQVIMESLVSEGNDEEEGDIILDDFSLQRRRKNIEWNEVQQIKNEDNDDNSYDSRVATPLLLTTGREETEPSHAVQLVEEPSSSNNKKHHKCSNAGDDPTSTTKRRKLVNESSNIRRENETLDKVSHLDTPSPLVAVGMSQGHSHKRRRYKDDEDESEERHFNDSLNLAVRKEEENEYGYLSTTKEKKQHQSEVPAKNFSSAYKKSKSFTAQLEALLQDGALY